VLPAADQYTIQDCECHEFAALVTLNTQQSSLYDQMVRLFELIDKYWDGNLARYTVTQVTTSDGLIAAAAAAVVIEAFLCLL